MKSLINKFDFWHYFCNSYFYYYIPLKLHLIRLNIIFKEIKCVLSCKFYVELSYMIVTIVLFHLLTCTINSLVLWIFAKIVDILLTCFKTHLEIIYS